MIQMPAASGEKYEAVGVPDTYFWSKGNEASLFVKGKECPKYVLIRPFADRVPDELFLTVDGKNHQMNSTFAVEFLKLRYCYN